MTSWLPATIPAMSTPATTAAAGSATSSSAAISFRDGIGLVDRYGTFGEVERRELELRLDEPADSGAAAGAFTVRGHAAVFDSWSLDLFAGMAGSFRERIARGAFDDVLERHPNVFLLWDHDTRYALARTPASKGLELRIDPRGLHFWARVTPTSYSDDLRALMAAGIIDEASFAFTVARDEWRIAETDDGDEVVERTILEVGELYDVTITAMGAYPAADSQLVASRALAYARSSGRLPATAGAHDVAPATPAGGDESRSTAGPSAKLERARRLARLRVERTPTPTP